MKILVVAGYLEANIKAGTSKRSIKGGASKSITNVVNGLSSIKTLPGEQLFLDIKKYTKN